MFWKDIGEVISLGAFCEEQNHGFHFLNNSAQRRGAQESNYRDCRESEVSTRSLKTTLLQCSNHHLACGKDHAFSLKCTLPRHFAYYQLL